MGLFKCIIKSIYETVALSDSSFGKFLRRNSPAERQKEMLKFEERRAEHIAAKHRLAGRGIKQMGMAMEMEYMARESERELAELEKSR